MYWCIVCFNVYKSCEYFPVPQKYSQPKAKYGVSVAKKKPPAK